MRFALRMGMALFAGVALAASAGAAAHAQQRVEVSAEVDKAEVAVGEIFTLRVRVSGALNPLEPEVPSFQGLRRVGAPSITTRTSIVNGVRKNELVYIYRFQATEVGMRTIEPITVYVSGRPHQTQPARIDVQMVLGGTATAAGAQTPQRQSAASARGSSWVEAEVDNEHPYLGEQITFTFRFYRRSAILPFAGRFGRPRYSPPDFTGFWNNQETKQEEFRERVEASDYEVVELRTTLFPTVVGTVIIDAATLSVPIDFGVSPDRMTAPPIVVEVSPLPADAPAIFTGAVGKYDITARIEVEEGKVNEAAQLTVTISGEGNVEALPDPVWPDFPGWRVFESPSTTRAELVAGRVIGTREYRTALAPERPGVLAIPPIRYVFFDPALEVYVEVATQPIETPVVESDGLAPLPAYATGGVVVRRTGADARHLKPAPVSLGRAGGALALTPLYWASWAVGLLAIMSAAVWRRRRASLENNLAASRRRNALPDALAALERMSQSSGDVRVIVADVLTGYIASRLHWPLAGLTQEALDRRLAEAGVPFELVVQVEGTLGAAEVAKYAPDAADPQSAEERFGRARRLLAELDEGMAG